MTSTPITNEISIFDIQLVGPSSRRYCNELVKLNAQEQFSGMEIQTSQGIETKCPHVLFYWELNPGHSKCSEFLQEVLPVLYVDLIFPLENKINILTDNQSVGQPFISPVLNQSKTIGFPSGCRVFGVRLSPLFAQNLFGSPLSDLQQNANDMASVIRGQLYSKMCDILYRDESFTTRVRLMDQLFCTQIGDVNQKVRCVNYCLEKLYGEEGCTVGQLAKETGYSSRWIEKLFQEYLGNSPRQVISIVRLNKLIELYKSGCHSRMIDYALDSGYYDHSHLVRELKKYAGKPPVAFRNEISSFTKIMNHL